MQNFTSSKIKNAILQFNLWLLLLLGLLPFAYGQGNPGSYEYSTDQNGTLYDMTGARVLIGANEDNVVSDNIFIPFHFMAMGSFHASLAVSTNGEVYLSHIANENPGFVLMPFPFTRHH